MKGAEVLSVNPKNAWLEETGSPLADELSELIRDPPKQIEIGKRCSFTNKDGWDPPSLDISSLSSFTSKVAFGV